MPAHTPNRLKLSEQRHGAGASFLYRPPIPRKIDGTHNADRAVAELGSYDSPAMQMPIDFLALL